ncbi:hypothetical protein TNCV_4806741 [Trichonephila clavipes]|nr:hypothetical protein TNCV_4806741 [Trichonephila clavipes]
MILLKLSQERDVGPIVPEALGLGPVGRCFKSFQPIISVQTTKRTVFVQKNLGKSETWAITKQEKNRIATFERDPGGILLIWASNTFQKLFKRNLTHPLRRMKAALFKRRAGLMERKASLRPVEQKVYAGTPNSSNFFVPQNRQNYKEYDTRMVDFRPWNAATQQRICRIRPDKKFFLFHHDNSRPHRSAQTQDVMGKLKFTVVP